MPLLSTNCRRCTAISGFAASGLTSRDGGCPVAAAAAVGSNRNEVLSAIFGDRAENSHGLVGARLQQSRFAIREIDEDFEPLRRRDAQPGHRHGSREKSAVRSCDMKG